jgi:hypothetical protein
LFLHFFFAVSVHAMKWIGLPALFCIASGASEDGTDVTDMLNDMIQASSGGSYSAGKGLIVRAPDFITGDPTKVVPATFWSNDIFAVSQFYPTRGNVWFPNSGSDGFGDITFQTSDLPKGPWTYASVGAVVGTAMQQLYPQFDNIQDDDWGWGVFYAKDSNAVDQRCEWWDSQGGYDCPGGWLQGANWDSSGSKHKGSGNYEAGNPNAYGGAENGYGGGAGCHYGHQDIDQPDSQDSSNNLVGDANCQCNYGLSGNDWADWLWQMSNKLKQKPGYENRNWLNGNGPAPSWAMDATICWVNNPRDLIKMQNQLWWNKQSWNNQMVPASNWDAWTVEEIRKYWGWNEIPVDRNVVEDANNWDAVMIKLPAAICGDGSMGGDDTAQCLGTQEKQALDEDLGSFVDSGKLIPGIGNLGGHPGSDVVFAREYGQFYSSSTKEGELGSSAQGTNWQRWFYCESITLGKYQIVHMKPSDDPNGNGACYIDFAGGPPSPPPPSPSGSNAIVHRASQKCLGTEGSGISRGQHLVFTNCDSSNAQQWTFDGAALKLTSGPMCADCGDSAQGSTLMLWDCNGYDQQKFGIDTAMGTIYEAASSDASLCVDVQGGAVSGDGVAWLWGCNSLDNQKFDWMSSTGAILA